LERLILESLVCRNHWHKLGSLETKALVGLFLLLPDDGLVRNGEAQHLGRLRLSSLDLFFERVKFRNWLGSVGELLGAEGVGRDLI
jgi:hypothetical protein